MIDHQMQELETADCYFVEKFCRSIYVDDVAISAPDVKAAYMFYLKIRYTLPKPTSILESSRATPLHFDNEL